MNEVFNILAESSITNEKKLKYDNKILTSEYLQNYILKSFIDKGLYADSVIVSIGDQCCYPHENGYGEIYANQSIIIDIFPKSRYNFYYTDMTRTFCKGRASDDLKKIYEAVSEAQKMCLDSIFAGCDAKILHKNIQEYFYNKGFKTGIINGMLQGFFHGTGHGVGLDCHELPLISLAGDKLPLNSVVTVEPGLYYIGIGGVRIEDIICVKEKSIENFTQFEKKLEIE
jgi:Xaa-Pro aminopeptidase